MTVDSFKSLPSCADKETVSSSCILTRCPCSQFNNQVLTLSVLPNIRPFISKSISMFRDFMRNLEQQHKTPPIHFYALTRPVWYPIKGNPSQLSTARITAVKSSYHPLAAHCQPNTVSCRKLLKQTEVPRYRKMVLTNEKHLELHRSAQVPCSGEQADLQCPSDLLLNDYHFLLQHVFQSHLHVSSKGEGRPKPADSKILWDKRWF